MLIPDKREYRTCFMKQDRALPLIKSIFYKVFKNKYAHILEILGKVYRNTNMIYFKIPSQPWKFKQMKTSKERRFD
jgi:hypothetical protein